MKRVLVVEDNEKNMYLVNRILEDAVYEVIPATTGKEGIELAIKEKPDMILMDIKLPDINGLEAAKKIRESKSCEKIPIIAITSFAMTGDKEESLAAGCTSYIEKPINPRTFIAEIEKYL